MKKPHKFLLFIILALIVAGCSPVVDSDQINSSHEYFQLSSKQSIGQSFVPHYAGLQGIQIYLSPDQVGEGQINFYLRSSSTGELNLANASVQLAEIKDDSFYRFVFTPIRELEYDRYFLVLDVKGEGSVLVASGDKDTYLDGAIYLNDEPTEAQMTFRLEYDLKLLTWGLIREILGWGYQFFLSMLVFLIPGLALLNLLWPASKKFSKLERAALAIGVSLAIYPILFLWTDLIGIHLGAGYAWIPLLLGMAYLIGSNWSGLKGNFRTLLNLKNIHFQRWNEIDFWQNLILIFILFLIFFVRFWVVRGLAGPMWGDSLQHTMMARLLVENKGLFDSWMPYAELSSFTYHFGFHSAVAVYHWISGAEVMDSVLWVGQLINGLSVFMLYPLVLNFNRKSRWGGIVAVLVAGLLLKYPMYYVNWGRYTQLAGQTILPILMVLVIELLRQRKINWKYVGLCCIVVGGLALTHYRVFAFCLLFIAIALIFLFRKGTIKTNLLKLTLVFVIAFMIFAPWLINIYNGKLQHIVTIKINEPIANEVPVFTYLSSLYTYLPGWIWGLYLLAIIYAVWSHQQAILIFVVWSIFLVIVINPSWLMLPGNGIIDTLSVYIVFYLPTAVSISIFLDSIMEKLKSWRKFSYIPLMIIIVVLGLYGVSQQRTIVDPSSYAYLTWPDKNAMAWIKENIPADSKILVNYEFSYGDSLISGIDSGWWIPMLTERKTNLPPLTYGSESGLEDDYYMQVMELGNYIYLSDLDNQEVIDRIIDKGYEYVFIGQHPLNAPILMPQELIASGKYFLVHHQDQVWIFKIMNSNRLQ